jgi:hypothetical protein
MAYGDPKFKRRTLVNPARVERRSRRWDNIRPKVRGPISSLWAPKGSSPINEAEALAWFKQNPKAVRGFLDSRSESLADFIKVAYGKTPDDPVGYAMASTEIKNSFLDAHSESALRFINDVYYT